MISLSIVDGEETIVGIETNGDELGTPITNAFYAMGHEGGGFIEGDALRRHR